MTDWLNCPRDITKYVGFVYEIKHRPTGRYYIGQKVFWNKLKRKPLKGRVNARHSLTESNWKDYWGSSKELDDFRKGREDEFDRRIIDVFTRKSMMNYIETKLQFEKGVLFDSLSFNRMINCRISQLQVNIQ